MPMSNGGAAKFISPWDMKDMGGGLPTPPPISASKSMPMPSPAGMGMGPMGGMKSPAMGVGGMGGGMPMGGMGLPTGGMGVGGMGGMMGGGGMPPMGGNRAASMPPMGGMGMWGGMEAEVWAWRAPQWVEEPMALVAAASRRRGHCRRDAEPSGRRRRHASAGEVEDARKQAGHYEYVQLTNKLRKGERCG